MRKCKLCDKGEITNHFYSFCKECDTEENNLKAYKPRPWVESQLTGRGISSWQEGFDFFD